MKANFILLILCILGFSLAFAQENFNQSDMSQAQSFVTSLPKSCGSDISIRSDGSVVVSFSCPGEGGGVAIGNVYIKNGKITKAN